MFKLSSRSLEKLEGVNPLLVDTVKEAINLSSVDFGVIYGVRSLAEQEKLYKSGRSQTMKSKHLIQDDKTSHAVDLMAYDGSNPSWDIVMYGRRNESCSVKNWSFNSLGSCMANRFYNRMGRNNGASHECLHRFT